MRLVTLFVLAAAMQTAAFAQKTSDPEARNKRAVSVTPQRRAVSAEPHRSGSAASPVKSSNSSTQDLAKIEKNGIQKMKATHKAGSASPAATPANTGAVQHEGKSMKFSYQPPKAADKTASTTGSRTQSPPKGRH